MQEEIKNHLIKLNNLLETAQNPKILLEEMQILSDKAFILQDELNVLLDKAEQAETDISELQQIFATREVVWDAITGIAKREMEVKEKSFKNHATKPQDDLVKTTHSHCSCSHHAEKEHHCCHNHTEEHHCCCHHEEEKAPKKSCCKGKKSCKKA